MSAEDAASGKLVSPAVTSKWRKGSGGPAGDECQNMVAPALVKRYGKGTDSDATDAPPMTEAGVRRLTPVECERLQAFPDGWTIPDDTDWREYPRPDGPRYAQMGNAVTVNVAEWIGSRLMEVSA